MRGDGYVKVLYINMQMNSNVTQDGLRHTDQLTNVIRFSTGCRRPKNVGANGKSKCHFNFKIIVNNLLGCS